MAPFKVAPAAMTESDVPGPGWAAIPKRENRRVTTMRIIAFMVGRHKTIL